MTTIHEVASAAGVSISTVSYALSGKRRVSESTRLRVESVAQELGYAPNAGARMLAGRRTHIFALTEPLRTDTHAPTHMAFVLATTIAARKRGFDILLLTDEEASAGMNRVAASGLVDAILVLDVAPDDERATIARTIGTPSVFVGVPDDSSGLLCVDLDFEAAGRIAVEKLADAGHRRIALIGQTQLSYRRSNFPRRLRSAFAERAAQLGLDSDVFDSGATDTEADTVQAAVDTAVDAGATGVVLHAADDVHEIVLARLMARGLQIGVDVSVISAAASFDTGTLSHPVDSMPLVPQQTCDLAAELAVRQLSGDSLEPGIHLIAPEYLEAGSVAPPR